MQHEMSFFTFSPRMGTSLGGESFTIPSSSLPGLSLLSDSDNPASFLFSICFKISSLCLSRIFAVTVSNMSAMFSFVYALVSRNGIFSAAASCFILHKILNEFLWFQCAFHDFIWEIFKVKLLWFIHILYLKIFWYSLIKGKTTVFLKGLHTRNSDANIKYLLTFSPCGASITRRSSLSLLFATKTIPTSSSPY